MLNLIATIGLVLFGIWGLWGLALLAYLASKIGKE